MLNISFPHGPIAIQITTVIYRNYQLPGISMETLAQSSSIVYLQAGDQRAALCTQVARI